MRRLAAVGIFLSLAIIHTWPVGAYPATRVLDSNDALLNAWLLAATSRQLAAHPLHPFDINMYYPFHSALAALDHQISNVLLVAPLTFARSPLTAANEFVVVSFVLAGLFMALLVYDLTRSFAASVVAGCVFAFSPARLENLPHTHVLGNFWLPLALAAVHRYVQRPTWTRLTAAMGSYLLLALASWYYAIIGVVGLGVVTLAELFVSRDVRATIVRRGLVGAIPVVLVLGAVARPYATIAQQFVTSAPHAADVPAREGAAEEPEPSIDRTMKASVMQALSAPVESYAAAPAAARPPWAARLERFGQPGARFFPGFIGALLALIAACEAARAQLSASRLAWIAAVFAVAAASVVMLVGAGAGEDVTAITGVPGFFAALLSAFLLWLLVPRATTAATARTYVVLAVTGALFSFGEVVYAFGVPLGHGVYPAALPPFNMLRAPARFGMLTVAAVAVLAGFGYAALERRVHRHVGRWLLAAVVLIAINLEMMVAPVETLRVGRAPDAYAWLESAPPGPVLEFPIHDNRWALYWSLFHRQRTSNGYGLIEPAAYHRLEEPDDLSLEMLEHARAYFHPRYILVNRSMYRDARDERLSENLQRAKEMLTPRGRFGTREVFEVFEVTGPSRGEIVTRSYPGWMVEHTERVAVRGRLDAQALRGTPVLQVWGNGELLSSVAQAAGAAAAEVVARLPTERARGVDIEVMGDYTLASGAGRPIGRTGRLAPVDIAVRVEPARTRIQINGHVWIGRKGYTLVTIDQNGRVEHVRGFNTSWSEAESHALADFVRSVGPDRVVVVASTFDVSRALTVDAVAALRTIGFTADLRGKFQWAHAGIGVSGATPGTVLESIGESSADCTVGEPDTIPVVVDDVRIY